MKYSIVHLLYRDASNYKYSGQFIVEGEITLEQMTPYLYEGMFVMVGPLGDAVNREIPHPGAENANEWPNADDDHVWVTITRTEIKEDLEYSTILCSSDELLAALKKLHSQWDDLVAQECTRLGL